MDGGHGSGGGENHNLRVRKEDVRDAAHGVHIVGKRHQRPAVRSDLHVPEPVVPVDHVRIPDVLTPVVHDAVEGEGGVASVVLGLPDLAHTLQQGGHLRSVADEPDGIAEKYRFFHGVMSPSDWDDGRFSDNNTSDDYLVLKFSDDRFYVTDSFNKDEHLDWWKHTKFAEYADNIEQLIKYEGDVQIGVQISIDVFGDLRDFSIVNIDERTFMKIDDIKVYELTGDYLKRGDQIEINTVKGHKYIILKRNGITYSLLNCIDRDSEWFQLNVGDNIYTYLANDTSIVSVTMKYKTALIGI